MKNYLLILTSLLAIVIATSCSNEESLIQSTDGGIDKIKATITQSETRTYMAADGLTTYWSKGDELGIYTAEGVSNILFTSTSDSDAYNGTFSGNLAGGTPQYAYYPYAATAGEGTQAQLTLAAEQAAESIADYDFKVMTSATQQSNGEYELLFTGVMAALNVNIDASGTPLADCNLTSVKVQVVPADEGADTPVVTGDFSLDLTDGTTLFSQGADYAKLVWAEPHALADGKAQAFMFVNPASIDQGSQLVVTFETEEGTTATATFTSAKDLEPNTMYSFDMVLGDLSDKVLYSGNPLLGVKFLQSTNDRLIKSSLYTGSGLSYGQDYVNSTTEYDIECTYNAAEGVWEGVIPYLYDFSDLVATFTTAEADATVYVEGVEQQSGVTANDYNDVVTYVVESASGVRQTAKVRIKNTGLPVVTITGTVYPKESDFIEGSTTINIDGTDYTCGMRLRGNSTQNMPKKPYAIKLDNKASILGMPKHKRWVLLANWLDRTMVRNDMAFYLAQQTGVWAPRGKHVEVVLNGVHVGNYLLGEQIKIDENRLNIAEVDDATVYTTDDEVAANVGFLLECDQSADETEIYFKIYSPVPFYVYIKDPGDAASVGGYGYNATRSYYYIKNYFSSVGSAMSNSNWTSLATIIDYQSFADYWLFSELTENQESKHPKSFYMHKDAGGKLCAGPAWDYDWGTFISMDNIGDNNSTAGSISNKFTMRYTMWYQYLFNDSAFVAVVKSRWAELKPKFDTSLAYLDELAASLELSDTFNHAMWPCTGFNKEFPNFDESLSYEDAIASMRAALEARIAWLDEQVNGL